jgi:uncharacterized membrane protein SpoIIM required for sporulation
MLWERAVLDQFVAQRKGEWQRLEQLIAIAQRKQVAALPAGEIMEMGYLYRRAVADLAIARRDLPNDRVCVYLNQLVARAHGVVYRPETSEWRRIGDFVRRGFPVQFRESLPFTGAAFLVFLVAAIAGFLAVQLVPSSAGYLVPADVLSSVKQQQMWTDNSPLPSQLMAGLIMGNNIQVALLAFAGGTLFGLLTFYIVATNGLMLGAIGGICAVYGLSLSLWSFVAPHGVIELTVIFIAGGCGLRIGHALLSPGLHTRTDALRQAAHSVVRLLFGCVPLLVIAGAIEGFVSPSILPPAVKLAVGALSAVLLYSYLFLAGRRA